MQARKLYLDTTGRNFVSDATAPAPLTPPVFFEGDVENIELYFLNPTGQPEAPYTYANYSGITATLRVGATTAAATVTSWSAISTTVTITASEILAGGSGTTEIQRIEISPPPVTGYYSVVLPTRNVTVSSVSSSVFTAPYHALLNGQSVTLTGFSTPSGFSNGSVYFISDRARDTFRIATTPGGTALTASVASGGGTAVVPVYTSKSLPAGSDPAAVASALNAAAGGSEISATGTATDYRLLFGGSYAGASFPTVTITANSLAGPPGFLGNLNLNVSAITALVAAGTTDVTIEVDVTNGTLRHTYQNAATLGNDL